MKIKKLHSGHIEVAVANLIGYRKFTIVPNVSWGLYLNHECDMLVLDDWGRFTEIEIKISMSDLKADFKKKHGHQSKIISRLIYAMPEEMLDKAEPLIPSGCGIIIVNSNHRATWHRRCKHDKNKETPSPSTVKKFYELGCMRIWSLKAHNNNR